MFKVNNKDADELFESVWQHLLWKSLFSSNTADISSVYFTHTCSVTAINSYDIQFREVIIQNKFKKMMFGKFIHYRVFSRLEKLKNIMTNFFDAEISINVPGHATPYSDCLHNWPTLSPPI